MPVKSAICLELKCFPVQCQSIKGVFGSDIESEINFKCKAKYETLDKITNEIIHGNVWDDKQKVQIFLEFTFIVFHENTR